jgi:hypothetical protein
VRPRLNEPLIFWPAKTPSFTSPLRSIVPWEEHAPAGFTKVRLSQ